MRVSGSPQDSQGVDKGVHRVVDRLGRLVGFWLVGGDGWGCPRDRLGLRLGSR